MLGGLQTEWYTAVCGTTDDLCFFMHSVYLVVTTNAHRGLCSIFRSGEPFVIEAPSLVSDVRSSIIEALTSGVRNTVQHRSTLTKPWTRVPISVLTEASTRRGWRGQDSGLAENWHPVTEFHHQEVQMQLGWSW